MEIKDIKPSMFGAKVYPLVGDNSETIFWWSQLSKEQSERMDRKLLIVERIAQKLAANMLKGVLKYDSDEHTVEEWFEYMRDDAVDVVNYMYLFEEAGG